MGAIKEYVCFAHGEFEGTEARCPHGCTTAVEREFRTAPAASSPKTRATDTALERLAQRFGLSDISNRNGSVAGSKPAAPAGLDFAPKWLPVAKGDIFQKDVGVVARDGGGGEGGAAATAKQYHTERMGEEPMATETVPLPLGKLPPPPRPHVVGRDTVSSSDFAKAVRSAA